MNGNDTNHPWGGLTRAQLDLQSLLDHVARKAAEQLGAEAAVLLLLDESRQTLILKASVGLIGVAVNTVRLPKDRGVSWKVIRENRPVALRVARDDPDFEFVPLSGEDRFTSFLGVPVSDGEEILGPLYVQTAGPRDFGEEDTRKLAALAAEAASAIRAARDFDRLQGKVRSLGGLNAIAQAINATNNIAEIMRHAMRACGELIGARNCVLWVAGPGGALDAHAPESAGDLEWMRPVREGIARAAISARQPVYVPDIMRDKTHPSLERVASVSVLCVPMVFEDCALGVMLLADKTTGAHDYFTAFSSEESQLAQSLAQTLAQAIHRAQTYERLRVTLEENTRNVRELSILFELSMAMQRTLTLDDLLRVILSCVTVGRGLGFNRAILFLINESTGLLQGMIGMGPDSPEQAGQIWSSLSSQPSEDLVPWLVHRDPYAIERSQFNRHAKSLRFEVAGAAASTILKRVVKERVTVNVRGPQDLDAADSPLRDALGTEWFAIAPLVARDATLGAIVVDNKYNLNAITDPDIRLLGRFAAPAAWAIDNVRLFERWASANKQLLNLESQMARVERMSTLGELAALLAHEIKNPLVSIGGFARRLASAVPPDSDEQRYTRIIVEEVERLETLLRTALDVSKDVELQRIASELNPIVEDCANFYWRLMLERGIEVSMRLAPDLPKALIDPTWIRQVVVNLILNAIEAMSNQPSGQPRHLTLETAPVTDRGRVRFRIADTGGGIASDDINSIFSPFFTTKPEGTGLGLSLCKKIVRLHHGTLEIDNQRGVGVTFTIELPCLSEVRRPAS